jgi:hypothetical protein
MGNPYKATLTKPRIGIPDKEPLTEVSNPYRSKNPSPASPHISMSVTALGFIFDFSKINYLFIFDFIVLPASPRSMSVTARSSFPTRLTPSIATCVACCPSQVLYNLGINVQP